MAGSRWAGVTLVGVLLFAPMAAARPAAHDPTTARVTFAREIRAILSARCTVCHAPGGSAPMPLTTYEEVRPWARAIKEQVLTRRMPRWHAARGYGAFLNDPTLTPVEMALIASWVDAELPKGADGAGRATSAGARRARGAVALVLPAGATRASVGGGSRWISGWSFEPGDPLITSATITSDAGGIGTWVAGDSAVALPRGTAMRVRGRLRVEVERRAAADYEQPFASKRSVLRLVVRPTRPPRRAWTQTSTCAAAQSAAPAHVIAVRPVLPGGADARIAIARTGAPVTIVGWFRAFEPAYPRTYWLARPAEFGPDARVTADAPCDITLTLSSR